jgi:Type II secretion system (T2SS), protein E, N-terminal domain
MKIILPIAMRTWVARLKVVVSRCESCGKMLALRHLTARKAGIRMHDSWYCSSRCFRLAAEQEVVRLLKPANGQAAYVARMPLGLNLISHGLVTIEQLKKATDAQKETGGEIGELLVRQGAVSEKQVTAIRAAEWGCPVFTIPKRAARIGTHIPATLMRLHSMIPVHYVVRTNSLLVGFVHGVEYELLYAIEQMTGCETKPCFITPTEFRTQMHQREEAQGRATDSPPREIKFESHQNPEEIARVLCASGVEMEAEEALIARCREYLWGRLRSGAKAVDLLFKAD